MRDVDRRIHIDRRGFLRGSAAALPAAALAADSALRDLLEQGVASLDAESRARNGSPYLDVAWEGDRVAVLQAISTGAFFGKLRSDLVVTLYNQKPVWTRLGYEGASADKGGYLKRGFSDIDWLSNA